jgi:hypothetical protein
MQPDVLTQLAKRLYDLRHTARVIPFVQVGIGDGSQPDDWRPSEKYCHANVDVWVMRSPQYKAVRGWVIFDQSNNPLIPRPRFHFAAHSVIETPDAKLLDITPSLASQPYPFIRHPNSIEEFDELRNTFQIVHIDHYLDNSNAAN